MTLRQLCQYEVSSKSTNAEPTKDMKLTQRSAGYRLMDGSCLQRDMIGCGWGRSQPSGGDYQCQPRAGRTPCRLRPRPPPAAPTHAAVEFVEYGCEVGALGSVDLVSPALGLGEPQSPGRSGHRRCRTGSPDSTRTTAMVPIAPPRPVLAGSGSSTPEQAARLDYMAPRRQAVSPGVGRSGKAADLSNTPALPGQAAA